MIQLLASINQLPSLAALTHEEIMSVAAVIQSLEHVNVEHFREGLHDSNILFNAQKQALILQYIEQYHQISTASFAFFTNLSQVLSLSQDGALIGADGLLPLVIELMPRSPVKLNRLLEQLETLLYFTPYGELSYHFTTLKGAAMMKLDDLSSKQSDQQARRSTSRGEELLSNVGHQLREEDRLLRRLSKMKWVCEQYQNELRNDFMHALIYRENPLYLRYFQGEHAGVPAEERMEAMFDAVHHRREIMPETIVDYANRYILVKDLCGTLSAENKTPAQRAAEFTTKFNRHREQLDDYEVQPSGFLKSILHYLCLCYYMGRSENHQAFLARAGLFGVAQDRKATRIPVAPWIHKLR